MKSHVHRILNLDLREARDNVYYFMLEISSIYILYMYQCTKIFIFVLCRQWFYKTERETAGR